MIVFLDTSAFAALENRRDAQHRRAVRQYRKLIREKASLCTSDYVFDETVTLLKVRAGPDLALWWAQRLLSSSLIEMIAIDRERIVEAVEIFAGVLDQPFSFTDCTSFALMRARSIGIAFAFDEDFRRFGFEQVPRDR